ncbi:hypothetical protein L0F63_006372, partial [Massospora cicadina]
LGSETGAATESAVSTLAFLAQLYLGSLARASKRNAELAGRTMANALDVAQSLEEYQVGFDELLAFAQDTVDLPSVMPSTQGIRAFLVHRIRVLEL